MSASFISIMLKGPKKLSLSKKDTTLLISRMERMQHQIWQAMETYYDEDGVTVTLPKKMAWLEDKTQSQREGLRDMDVSVLIADFKQLWNENNAEDVAVRDFGKERVICCGEMTWGDEPQSPNYQLLSDACAFPMLLKAFKVL